MDTELHPPVIQPFPHLPVHLTHLDMALEGPVVPTPDARAIALELGIHNSALAIAVGASLADDLAIPAAVYSTFMLFTGGLFAWTMSRRNAPHLRARR